MLIAIFGESCTGKSTIASELSKRTNATVYTGKDYIKLAKNELEAKKQFEELLNRSVASADTLIYVISEKEHLALLPPGAIRVMVCVELEVIKSRFARRMNGNLPAPVAAMLEKKHGVFDSEPHDLRIDNTEQSLSDICDTILGLQESKNA